MSSDLGERDAAIRDADYSRDREVERRARCRAFGRRIIGAWVYCSFCERVHQESSPCLPSGVASGDPVQYVYDASTGRVSAYVQPLRATPTELKRVDQELARRNQLT